MTDFRGLPVVPAGDPPPAPSAPLHNGASGTDRRAHCLDFLRQPGTRLVTWPGSSRITTTPEHSTVPPVPRNTGRNAEQIPRPPRHPSGPTANFIADPQLIQVNLKTAVVLDQVDQRIRPAPSRVRRCAATVVGSPSRQRQRPAPERHAPAAGFHAGLPPSPAAPTGSRGRRGRSTGCSRAVRVRSTGSAAGGTPRDSPRQLSIMVRGSGSPPCDGRWLVGIYARGPIGHPNEDPVGSS